MYNRIARLDGDRRREMKQLIKAIKNDDDKIMADLIRFMCRLRPNTIGLRKRIEAEAALIELADSPVPPADILKIME